MREGAEELTFFLGDKRQLEERIQQAGGAYKLVHNNYHIHLFQMDYDENLPVYYNNNHKNLWEKLDSSYLEKSKFFEKKEIHWFSVAEMKSRRHQFRPFYQEILDEIIRQVPKIQRFITHKKTKLVRLSRRGSSPELTRISTPFRVRSSTPRFLRTQKKRKKHRKTVKN